MLNISLLALTLCGGVLVQPFRIAEAEPGHHQGCLRAAMAPDGHFAVAWVDYLRVDYPPFRELELFVRFFDPDGNPLTDAYKITKAADTNQIDSPHLDMDSQGNAVLVWIEYGWMEPNDGFLRLQLFDTSGSALDSYQIDPQGEISISNRSVSVSLNDQAEFAIAWAWDAEVICARRYSFDSGPQGDPFRVHDDLPDGVFSNYPGVALNDAGDLVVTWLEWLTAKHLYPRFQAFDAEDEPILDWEPMGHRIDDGEDEQYHGSRPEVYWLDNDRFVVFWGDWSTNSPVGRVFSDKGLTRHPIRWLIWRDSLRLAHGGNEGWYSTAVAPNDSFAYTHMRTHSDYPDTSDPSKKRYWDHGGAILGYIQDNEPIRRTTLFEYTPAWGADTVDGDRYNHYHALPPAVACCDDRIVWVYSRPNPDTIFEAYAMITDWDMGIGVVEQPIVEKPPNWEVITSIGSQIVLRYQDSPDGFRASIFDATGRKVDEVESPAQNGVLTWGENHSPGVYFIVLKSAGAAKAQKVVLIR